jgi:hypothetical protein
MIQTSVDFDGERYLCTKLLDDRVFLTAITEYNSKHLRWSKPIVYDIPTVIPSIVEGNRVLLCMQP